MRLAELQAGIRNAVVAGDDAALAGVLFGGRDPVKRLSIHRRHYRASVAQAIIAKFPACAWLLGSAALNEAALAFVDAQPPAAPCLAEYGADFPAFLAAAIGSRVPYLHPFAALEWLMGAASVALDEPAASIAALAALDPASLPAVRLRLQPGCAVLSAQWPVQELMRVRIAAEKPDSFRFEPQETHLEIRGARGTATVRLLDAPAACFRRAVIAGADIGTAAEAALAVDEAFDPGAALAALFAEHLAVVVIAPAAEDAP